MFAAASYKRIVYGLGMTLAFVSLLYVIGQAYDERIWEVEREVLVRMAGAAAAGTLVYMIGSLLLAVAWHAELAWSGEGPRSRMQSIGIYGRAQLAKYVPGNVFSLLGRQILGRQAGFSHKVLAWASVFELFGMIYAAGLLACAGAGDYMSSAIGISRAEFVAGTIGVAFLPLLVIRFLQRFEMTSRLALPVKSIKSYLQLNLIFLIYVPFFVVSGVVFGILMRAASPDVEFGWLQITGAVSAAWLVGTITPGASAGIGIRDALLLFAVAGMLEGSLATLVVVFYRILTLAGDVGFFGLAALVRLPVDVRGAHTP